MILKNSLYNLLGMGAPLLAAVGTIPVLIHALGADRFGALTLIWALVSYAGLLDLGLGRALTLRMSNLLGSGRDEIVPLAISSAVWALAVLGLLIATVLAISSNWLSSVLFQLGGEGSNAVIASAFAVPLILISAGFRGVLEARHSFGVVNLIRVPLGVATFVAPLLAVFFFGPRLDAAAWSLTIVRAATTLPMALPTIGERWVPVKPNWGEVRTLLRTGGWLSLAATVAPVMNYLDRFLIAALVSAGAVAYYVTPQEIVTKVWILPGAITGVLFPVFAKELSSGAFERALTLYCRSVMGVCLMTAPICALIALFSHPLLALWIGADFAANGSLPLTLLAIGVFFSSIAHVPVTYLQSSGRSRQTAALSVAQIPIYSAALWFAVTRYDIVGAAWVWLGRSVLDASALFGLAALGLARDRQKTQNEIAAKALMAHRRVESK